jgi:hypothetical protein
LILSFAYELPILELTPYDRLNPRLFDFMFVLGVFTVLPRLRRGMRVPSLFRIWAALVSVFCLCALSWAVLFLPWEYGQFSLFFAGKYIEGLIIIYMAFRIPMDTRQKRIIHRMVIVGGMFVAFYAVPQYINSKPEVGEWEISGGKAVSTYGQVVFGPLSRSYFHIGIFSTLALAMALALVSTPRSVGRSWLYLGLALFVAWPALVCGSRAAILGVVLVLVATSLAKPRVAKKLAILGVVALLSVHALNVNIKAEKIEGISRGLERFSEYEGDSPDSLVNRLFIDFSIREYVWGGLLVPFIGAGFYVAPVGTDLATATYRVGYGAHNTYLFAFEQGGTIAFLLFLLFLLWAMRCLYKMKGSSFSVDSEFGLGMFSFLIALLVVSFGGQVFWQGFNTGNLNTYIVLLLVLGTSQTALKNRELPPKTRFFKSASQ